MQRVAASLDVEATFLYTPTALFVSFPNGLMERTFLRRVDAGEVDVGKLIEFDEVLENLDDGIIDLATARSALDEIVQKPARYAPWMIAVASSVGCASAAVFFGAGLVEVLTALTLGFLICTIGWGLRYASIEGVVVEPLAGFVAALISIFVAYWIWPMDDRLATLASLIILIPGLTFTTAMTELASRHLSAGVARMAGASTTLLTLMMGVALAWRIGNPLRPEGPVAPVQLPDWATWVALMIAPIAFAILFQARAREFWVITVISWLGFIAARVGHQTLGNEFGPFFGALTVGVGSNAYARWLDRPAMVPLTPSLLILVPGSLGYLSLSSFLDQRAIEGVELAFGMILVAISLVGGLLAANAIVPARRAL